MGLEMVEEVGKLSKSEEDPERELAWATIGGANPKLGSRNTREGCRYGLIEATT